MSRARLYCINGLLGVRVYSVIITKLYEEARCVEYICDCGRSGLANGKQIIHPRSTFRDCGCGIHADKLAGKYVPLRRGL